MLGTLCRYGLGTWVEQSVPSPFPYGTAVINLAGCFMAGLLFPIFDRTSIAPELRLAVFTGFLGGFTTFSAYGLQTVVLEERRGNRRHAPPGIVEAQADGAGRELQIASDVGGDLVRDHRSVAVVSQVTKLGLELLTRDVVEVKHREERTETSAEDKGRKAAAHEVETAAGFAASL